MDDSPTGHAVLREAVRELGRAGIDDARTDARILLAYALGIPLSRLDLQLGRSLPPEVIQRFSRLVGERAARRPLAYITGDTEFMGLRLKCDERALVPRPETEVLVEEVQRRLPAGEPGLLLDLGAGTGAIALSLLKLIPTLRAVLTDASPAALSLAQENAELLGVAERAQFLEGRDLEPVIARGLAESITILVSNPPYIAPHDVPHLPPEVALHEPSEAWRGEGEEGVGFYERTIPQCATKLPSLRLAAFEVGVGQAARVAAVCREAWPSGTVSVVNDLGGVERVVIVECGVE